MRCLGGAAVSIPIVLVLCAFFAPRVWGQQNDDAAGALVVRFRVSTVNDPDVEKAAARAARQFVEMKIPVVPRFQNLCAGEWLFMRTPRCVMAVEVRSGKRIWEYPWYESPFSSAGGRQAKRESAAREGILTQRLWEDAVFAHITSDGESVFILDKLGGIVAGRLPNRVVVAGGLREPDDFPTSNELVSLDIKSHGKLRWVIGGETGGEEPALAKIFFLSAGTVHEGKLYLVGEIENKLRLVAVDAKPGKLDWQLDLLEVKKGRGTGADLLERLRRLAGVRPVVIGKWLLCPTALGRVVAVDLETHNTAWEYEYDRLTVDLRPEGVKLFDAFQYWADNAVLAAGDAVLVTPADSSFLHCLDLATGEARWIVPRGDRRYVAVAEDVCLLVGPRDVSAVSVRNGRPLWDGRTIEIPDDALPSGRGAFDGERYLLPTTAAKLLTIDWRTGKLIEAAPIADDGEPIVLGNLLLHDDALISQGHDWLQKLSRAARAAEHPK
jgi:outer membrane protein assembly factor BamB